MDQQDQDWLCITVAELGAAKHYNHSVYDEG